MTDTVAKPEPILSQVSPTLHPDSATPFAAAGDAAMSAARATLTSIYRGLDAMTTAEHTTRQTFGTTQVVDGAEIKLAIPQDRATILAADLGDRFAKIARQFDGSMITINEGIAGLENKIAKTLVSAARDPMAATEAADARKYIAGLPPAERMGVLHAADLAVVQACLAAPYAAGIGKDQAVALRSLASDRFAKPEVDQLSAAVALRSHLQNSSKLFVGKFRTLMPTLAETPQSKAQKALKAG
jgi:hypothetical protein